MVALYGFVRTYRTLVKIDIRHMGSTPSSLPRIDLSTDVVA
jgi:hypothetical protein